MGEGNNEARADQNSHYFALPRGMMLHEFQVESVLGHGGFGITYRAVDTLLQEAVAIKEYFPNELAGRVATAAVRAKSAADQRDFNAGLDTFLEEARLITRFRHPNIVHVRRFFEMHETGYIVLDYERGQTLGRRLDAGLLPPDELKSTLLGMLDGLEAIHARAVLHRDLKPSNVILREDGSPVLIDFGAARDFKERRSRSVTAIAAPGYSPPEQYGVGGQQGPWTDIYALGAIAYRCVTGAPPPNSLRRLRNDPLVPAAKAAAGKYDRALLQTINWMLEVNEADRPASVNAIRDTLMNTGRRRRLPAALGSLRTWSLAAGGIAAASLAAFAAANLETISRLTCDRTGILCAGPRTSTEPNITASVPAPSTSPSAPPQPNTVAVIPPKPAAVAAPAAAPRIVVRVPADPARRLAPDEVAWELLAEIADADQLRRFVAQFPDSPHRAEATAVLSALVPPAAAP